MKIISEQSLKNFEFWSGARETAASLTCEELDKIESILEGAYPEGMTDTEINDFFWFEDGILAYWLGADDEYSGSEWLADREDFETYEEWKERTTEPEDEDESEDEDEDEDQSESYNLKQLAGGL